MTRRVILSKERALAIVEAIAVKHDLAVRVALCSKRDRYAVACRAEIAHELKAQLNWSTRQTGDLLGVSSPAVCKLLGLHEIAIRRAQRSLPVSDLKALDALGSDALKLRLVNAESMVAFLQGEIDRLTGAGLIPRLAASFQLENKLRCAIVLAIVAEAYPRAVGLSDMIEFYDVACERLNYGRGSASANLITKNISHLREHFRDMGLPDPISTGDSRLGTRALRDDVAQLMHDRLGVPRLSQLARVAGQPGVMAA